MDFNNGKYYIQGSNLLTEVEKIQMARDLLELERQGVIEWRDGTWGLADGVEVEEKPVEPVARFCNKERGSN